LVVVEIRLEDQSKRTDHENIAALAVIDGIRIHVPIFSLGHERNGPDSAPLRRMNERQIN